MKRAELRRGGSAPKLQAVAALLRLLALLAFVLAPVGMMGGHASAMPVQAVVAADHGGHCADMKPDVTDEQQSESSATIDCAIACACTPAGAHRIAERVRLAAAFPPGLAPAFVVARNPAADPPPPRLS